MSLSCQLEKASEGSVFCCETLKYIESALTSSMEGVKATLLQVGCINFAINAGKIV